MIFLKAWLVIHSGLGAELWHLALPLALYLWLARRFDGSLASPRALMIVALLVIGAEAEEWVEKLIFGWKSLISDILGDIRDGLFWPGILCLTGRFYTPRITGQPA